MKEFFELFNQSFTFFCIFPCMICLGLYLTFKLGWVQFTKIKEGFYHLLAKKKNCEGNISHFEAISTVLAGNFGTGNISGMAVAIATGGPGALVWMWVMAFLGAVIQFASCILAVKYRSQNENGEYVGGPMYYLSKGLGYQKCATLFCIFTILAAFTAGIFAQMNSMVLPIQELGVHPFLFGVIVAFFVAIVILGKIDTFSRMASFVVPIKAFLYLLFGLIILFLHADQVWPALKLMFQAAVTPEALVGGTLAKVISTGFDRGLFATDAGTGLVPMLQSNARTEHPVVDGLVTLVAPLMVMIVCTMTGLILLVTGAWQQPGLASTNMVTFAFREGLGSWIGEAVVIVALMLFGYTTILAYSACAEKAVGYLWGTKSTKIYKWAFILTIPLGCFLHVDMVWVLADICITLMLLFNMIGIVRLAHVVVSDTRSYYKNLALQNN